MGLSILDCVLYTVVSSAILVALAALANQSNLLSDIKRRHIKIQEQLTNGALASCNAVSSSYGDLSVCEQNGTRITKLSDQTR